MQARSDHRRDHMQAVVADADDRSRIQVERQIVAVWARKTPRTRAAASSRLYPASRNSLMIERLHTCETPGCGFP